MIKRTIQTAIEARFFKGKTIVLLGARQVGKTTLLKQLEKEIAPIWINADDPQDRALLNNLTIDRAKALFGPGTLLFIDEAQRLDNTGLTIKLIHDNCQNIQIIATGSSSFELNDRLKEALTGRKRTFHLFPISISELINHSNGIEVNRNLEIRLLFGSYPEVISNPGEEKIILRELASDYLYKDVFSLQNIRKPNHLEKLLQALALQLGNEVSYRELATLTKLDKNTIERYILLLEEAFVIFKLPSFSRNLRTELTKAKKIYFIDNGIRNALISQYQPLSLRNDVGALWENFIISERLKLNSYNLSKNVNPFFWRTTQQQEIDYLEVV
ncbi:MAG: ATP-binding protein, partial [Bacteroidota bacterium]